MANQPKPPPRPEPPKPAPEPPAAKAEAHAYEPEPVRTIADEQRERSAELEDKGVEAVKAEHDERSEEDKQRSRPVAGVSHRPIEPHETARR